MTLITYKANSSAATLTTYLTETDKFVTVHPLIYRMEHLGGNNYKVYEKVTFGFIPINFTYKATISQSNGRVLIDATVMRLTKLSMNFSFDEQRDHTIVNEELEIKSPLPIHRFMVNLIKEQHQLMFEAIEKIS